MKFIKVTTVLIAILLLFSCEQSEEEPQRKSLRKDDLESISYLIPNFQENELINYDDTIFYSEDVSWSDVIKGYQYQLSLVEEYKEIHEKVYNDYYKGYIVGDEIHEAARALINLHLILTGSSVILPIDASPELKDLARSMNWKIFDMAGSVGSNYDFVYEGGQYIEIIKTYDTLSLEFGDIKVEFEELQAKLERIVNERE